MKAISIVTLSEGYDKKSGPTYKRSIALFEAKIRRTDGAIVWRKLTLLGTPVWDMYKGKLEKLDPGAKEMAKKLRLEYRENIVQGSKVLGLSPVEILSFGVVY